MRHPKPLNLAISILALTLAGCAQPTGSTDDPAADPVSPSLDDPIVRGKQGDTTAIDLSFGTADQVAMQIGDEAETNYELRAVVSANGNDATRLFFDTTAAGDEYATLLTRDDVGIRTNKETELDSLLEEGAYEIQLKVPDHASSALVDTGTLDVRSGSIAMPSLVDSLVDVDQGNVADIPVDAGDVDRIWVRIGDSDTLTATADASVDVLSESSLSTPLSTGYYPLRMRLRDQSGTEVAVGTVSVRKP